MKLRITAHCCPPRRKSLEVKTLPTLRVRGWSTAGFCCSPVLGQFCERAAPFLFGGSASFLPLACCLFKSRTVLLPRSLFSLTESRGHLPMGPSSYFSPTRLSSHRTVMRGAVPADVRWQPVSLDLAILPFCGYLLHACDPVVRNTYFGGSLVQAQFAEWKPPIQPTNPRSLTIALIGPPNAGKSSLMNAFLGVTLSAVSNKVNTTRSFSLAPKGVFLAVGY